MATAPGPGRPSPSTWPGAFLLGCFVAALRGHRAESHGFALLTTGLCGTLTTFATFQLELFEMFDAGNVGLALPYAAATIAVGYSCRPRRVRPSARPSHVRGWAGRPGERGERRGLDRRRPARRPDGGRPLRRRRAPLRAPGAAVPARDPRRQPARHPGPRHRRRRRAQRRGAARSSPAAVTGSFTTFSTWMLDSERLAGSAAASSRRSTSASRWPPASPPSRSATGSARRSERGTGSSFAVRPCLYLDLQDERRRPNRSDRRSADRRSRRWRPARVPLAELEDGQQVAGIYAVRGRELRRKRNGDPWLKLTLGDASGSVEAVAWEDAEACHGVAAPGTPVMVEGCFEVSDRWGAKIKLTTLREARESEFETEDLAVESVVSIERLEGDLRELLATVQTPQLRELLGALLRRGLADLGALPRRPGGEGLPPGLPPRAARAHALGRAGGLGRVGLLPGHRPRRRPHRGPAPRHRQDRGLQRRPAGDRPHRPRPAAGRDPARLLPGPPPDRGHPRLRPGPGAGRPPHHPQPPRLARARLAGGARRRARRSSST